MTTTHTHDPVREYTLYARTEEGWPYPVLEGARMTRSEAIRYTREHAAEHGSWDLRLFDWCGIELAWRDA